MGAKQAYATAVLVRAVKVAARTASAVFMQMMMMLMMMIVARTPALPDVQMARVWGAPSQSQDAPSHVQPLALHVYCVWLK